MSNSSVCRVGRRSGQVMVLFALALLATMVILLAMTADVGKMLNARATLQNGCDAAALAGVQVLLEGRLDEGLGEMEARGKARAAALQLHQDNCPGTEIDIDFGVIDEAGEFVVTADSEPATACRARIGRTAACDAGALDMSFSGIFGMDEVDVRSEAIASLFANIQGAEGLVPFAVRDTAIAALGEEMVFYPWDPITGNFGLVNMDGEAGGGAAELKAAIEGGGATLILVGDGMWADGETGIVATIEKPMQSLVGKPIMILIWDESSSTIGDTGTSVKYHVTGFLAATVTYVSLTGASDKSELRVRVEDVMTPEELGVKVWLGPGGDPSPNIRKIALYR